MALPLARKALPLVRRAVARIEADHAGQALPRRLRVLGRVVGAGRLVVRGVEFAGGAIDIGRGGEEFVHDVVLAATPGDALRQCAQRRAHDAVIDQLAAGQALGVSARRGEHMAAAQRDEVGGGAADVDQQRIVLGELHRGVQGGRQPVGRGDMPPLRRHLVGPAPAGIAGEEVQRGGYEGLRQHRGNAPHAVFAVDEQIDHLAGHRHRMLGLLKRRPALPRSGQRVMQVLQTLPQRTRPLRSVDHLAAAQQARLDMRTADVPADQRGLTHAATPPPGCGRAPPTGPHRRRSGAG
jgi:hypothetical protein